MQDPFLTHEQLKHLATDSESVNKDNFRRKSTNKTIKGEVETISYGKLLSHIAAVHPRENGKVFSCCVDIGCFPCCYWNKKPIGVEGVEVVEIAEVNKQIGLGPTLFMMLTKSLSYFFLLMTILNLPIMWLYYSANYEENYWTANADVPARLLEDISKDETSSETASAFQNLLDIMEKTSIGNIGRLKAGCFKVKMGAQNRGFEPFLSCAMGTMFSGEDGDLIRVGYIGDAKSNCNSDFSAP